MGLKLEIVVEKLKSFDPYSNFPEILAHQPTSQTASATDLNVAGILFLYR